MSWGEICVLGDSVSLGESLCPGGYSIPWGGRTLCSEDSLSEVLSCMVIFLWMLTPRWKLKLLLGLWLVNSKQALKSKQIYYSSQGPPAPTASLSKDA